MATFHYRGRNPSGQLVTGDADAETADAVAGQLMQKGITPVQITPQKTQPTASFKAPFLFFASVSQDEMILLCRQLYSLTRSGVVLNKAFRGLSESVRNEYFSKILAEIESSLNSGKNLTTALRKHPKVFNELFINIIQVGENSGQLDYSFKQLSIYLEQEKDTRRRIGTALRYPVMVMLALIIAMVVLNIWVIPIFADMFERFNTELPLATRILLATSSIMTNHWQTLLVATMTLIIALRYYLNTPKGRLLWHQCKLKIPLVGSILERASLARFCRSFAMMMKAGVPLINALELSSKAIGNDFMAIKVQSMRSGIQRGDSLLRTARACGLFTPLVMQMIQVGDETGRIDELLDEVAMFYEQEVDYELKNLSSSIEPIMLVMMSGLVMVLALGIFLPMWDMMSVVQ